MATAAKNKRAGKLTNRQRTHAKHRSNRSGVSRAKLETVRENLEGTQAALDDTLNRFWIVPEHDVLGTLARTKRRIGKAVTLLRKAA